MTTAFSNSGIIGSGTLDSLIICFNIKRTRYYKQLWVVALEVLKRRGYLSYIDGDTNDESLNGPELPSESQERSMQEATSSRIFH